MSSNDLSDFLIHHCTFRDVLLGGISLYLLYGILLCFYRLTLHPLAQFPGPKLAAATFWYEFYYDLFPHKLLYLWKIEEMHKKYGPIVRINPIHLHINDPNYLDEIYAGGKRKRNRDPWYYRSEPNGPLGWSVFQTVDHDVHRMRRAALNRFFSKRSVQEHEQMIMNKIETLCGRFAEACRTGDVVSLTFACGALTMDVISAYAFGADTDNLTRQDFGAEYLEAYSKLSQFGPVGRQFPWLAKACLTLIPSNLIHRISPAAALIPRNRLFFRGMIEESVRQQEEDKIDKREDSFQAEKESQKNKSIFQDILRSNLPPSEKAPARLAAEANLLLIAGTETTARALSLVLFHILDNPQTLLQLREELAPLMPHPDSRVSVAALESLRFFPAVITEGIRLSHVVSSRMPRYAPDETLRYGKWIIPAGARVMQSHYLHHMNPDIFLNPYMFNPHRWLENPELKQNYFMGFGKGSRICLGINLVHAELYLAVARLVTRFDMRLHDTIRERDVDVKRDCIIGLPSLEGRGIRVMITQDKAG
ncbi:benzoate 4-monooxygenase cytochrome P450 [Aspergillus flavus AF70]|nr:benzoate 4-monooxygenase cytochrome P450 [Aspergillus flavus AF70]